MGKIVFSIVMVIIILFIVHYLVKRYELNKNQRIIFWLLVLFWTSISIIRAYRKVYMVTPIEYGGLGQSAVAAAIVASAYGLVSACIRLPIFFATDIFGNRKIFIQIALIFVTITSVLVVIKPSYNTLYLSSLAMGVCASMLAVFNVMFSETFETDKAAVSASILAIAPLLAEFMAAPIQYLGTYDAIKNFSLLWLISAVIGLFTFILSLFMKDLVSSTKFTKEKVLHVLSNKKFIIACFVAIVISFVKFATSGANMVLYARQILKMNPIMLAYLDTVFSSSQLFSSILVGTYFKNKFGIEKTLLLSVLSLITFYIISIITTNPYILFVTYIFNGFGYGGTYVSLIALAMQYFDKEYRNISMGIFQGFFAFGIFFADRIYVWLEKDNILKTMLNKTLGDNIYNWLDTNDKIIFVIVLLISIVSLITIALRMIKNEKNI